MRARAIGQRKLSVRPDGRWVTRILSSCKRFARLAELQYKLTAPLDVAASRIKRQSQISLYTERAGHISRITGFAVVNLAKEMGAYDWRFATGNVWKVERMLLEWPHRRIASSDRRVDRLRRRYRAFRAAHGYKPGKYYRGRDRLTARPPEFRGTG